jgi:predicted Zn-dependent protease
LSEACPEFVGHLLYSSFEGDPPEGKILLDPWRLRFETTDLNLEIPLVRLEIEVHKAQGGRIVFTDPEQPGWSIYTFDPEILEHRLLLQQTHTRAQIQAMHSSEEVKRRLWITAAFFVTCVLLALGISSLTRLLVRSLVARVPPKWEQSLGDSLLAEVSQHERLLTEPKLLARLDRAVAPLLPAIPNPGFDFKFHILDDPLPNAFALPGGHVLVTAGLLELMDRPEEIAGVVAHELAHVTQKHGLRKAISAAGPYLIFRVFLRQGDGLLGILNESSQLLVQQSFSQEYELDADRVGWRYLVAARIDPRGFIEGLNKLRAEQMRMRGLPSAMFSSHPPTEKRIERLEAAWEKLPQKSGFIDFNEPSKR